MKNLHLLPTDKPSRLWITWEKQLGLHPTITNSLLDKQHIYITSNEEIKEGDWACHKNITNDKYQIVKCNSSNKESIQEHWKKIILTTDQDLIADGVQAIDDEFLEWFVKNPSCEWVDININFGYPEIIIPKEEPKQYPIGGYAPGFYSCTCVTCEQSFMGDKRAVQCESCAIETTQESMQEVPEKTKGLVYWKANAEEDYIKVPISVLRYIAELESRMYSETIEFAEWIRSKDFQTASKNRWIGLDMKYYTTEELFKQYKVNNK
jgi:hypothetical protein